VLVLDIDLKDEWCRSLRLGLVHGFVVFPELTAAATGSMAPSLLWGCLEVSLGVVSACIPSLVPLLLVMVGKKRVPKGNQSRSYVQHDQDHGNSSASRTDPSRRWMHRSNRDPPPEAVELTHANPAMVKDDDDINLVDGMENSREILVTTQISVNDSPPITTENTSHNV
jgi:hypothetical protein